MTSAPAKLVHDTAPPPEGTAERWAWDYLHTDQLEEKFSLAPLDSLVWESPPVSRIVQAPCRPSPLRVVTSSEKTPRGLKDPMKRARLVHTFLHHELQAAELMCWALLRFSDTPLGFRRGLLGVCRDEVRHMRLYRDYLADQGVAFGDFPVRDWFWQRVPACPTPLHFVATMGVGLEGGNLDHTARFAERFRACGDERGAELQQRVGQEEIAHVRFALKWYRHWSQSETFSEWRSALPEPLSPILMRGRPLNAEARRRAGMSEEFVQQLEAWEAT